MIPHSPLASAALFTLTYSFWQVAEEAHELDSARRPRRAAV
jgi:hypothetical protein